MNGHDAEPLVYVHGDLDLKIIEARRLPNMDLLTERIRRFFTVFTSCRKPFFQEEG